MYVVSFCLFIFSLGDIQHPKSTRRSTTNITDSQEQVRAECVGCLMGWWVGGMMSSWVGWRFVVLEGLWDIRLMGWWDGELVS